MLSSAATPPRSTNVTANFLCASSEHTAASDSGSCGAHGANRLAANDSETAASTRRRRRSAASRGQAGASSFQYEPLTSASATSTAPHCNACPKHSMYSPVAASARRRASRRRAGSDGASAGALDVNASAKDFAAASLSPVSVAICS